MRRALGAALLVAFAVVALYYASGAGTLALLLLTLATASAGAFGPPQGIVGHAYVNDNTASSNTIAASTSASET